MDPGTLERFKRAVEEEWRNPQVTAAYRKWDQEESDWGRAARDLIIDAGVRNASSRRQAPNQSRTSVPTCPQPLAHRERTSLKVL
jgi:hypothetical protein